MEHGSYKSLAIFSVITIMFVGSGDGERFFQYRDHRDQGMFDRERGSVAVHNKLEAEVRLFFHNCFICFKACLESVGHFTLPKLPVNIPDIGMLTMIPQLITKTCLFKYTENFTTKKTPKIFR